MASEQSPIFRLLRMYDFPTANLPIIFVLQIEQLFQNWKSSKYLITVHRKILTASNPYLEIIRRFIWLLRKAKFLATAHHTIIFQLIISQLYVYCKSTNYLTTGNRLIIWLLCIEKLNDVKSPIWNHFDDLYDYWAKPIFRILRIIKLFCYCATTIYLLLQTQQLVDQLNSSKYLVPCIEKLYDFKSPIWKHFDLI